MFICAADQSVLRDIEACSAKAYRTSRAKMQVNDSKRPTLTLRTRVDAGDRDSEEAIERGIAVRRGVPNDGGLGRCRFMRQHWRGVRSLEEHFRRRSRDQWD